MKKNHLLKKLTTIAVGGAAKYFSRVTNEKELAGALGFAIDNRLKWYVVGEGSNIIPADKGFDGLIIQNQIQRFEQSGNSVIVGAGNNLLNLIHKLNRLGYGGLEKMAGIPGTVGGAVYGSAGAYGQEIKDRVIEVGYYDTKLNKFKKLTKSQCKFSYRHSIFKDKKHWIIVDVKLRLKKGSGLTKTSKEIIKLREEKYKPGLKCPGSFFKNIKLDELKKVEREKLIQKINPEMVVYGKVPSGYLLEAVGAKGMKQGSVRVADHHANLIYNTNGAKAADIKKLANKLKNKVYKKFGIMLEEEVQYL